MERKLKGTWRKQGHHLGSVCNDAGGWDKGDDSGGGEKWSYSGYILKSEPTEEKRSISRMTTVSVLT